MLTGFFDISPGIYNLWIFSAIFFVISTGIMFFFPKHNIKKFIEVPDTGIKTKLNKLSYYLFFFISIFIPIKQNTLWFYFGSTVFSVGIILYTVSMFYFAISEYNLPVTQGIYKILRHPVYISFFLITAGMIIAGTSGFLLIVTILHFYTLIFIIKEEEKECEKKYGNLYIEYKQKTF